jgi:hypothetical protein
MMTTDPTRTETERGKKGRSNRPVALGKVNLLLALLGLILLIGAYRLGFLPEALALLVLTISLVTLASRAWHARRGGLEYGLLRHPFRRELRPYLLQCLNHWLFWALFGAASWRARSRLSRPLSRSSYRCPCRTRSPTNRS